MSTTSTIDSTKLAKLIETEEAMFNDRHHKSREMTERAREVAGRRRRLELAGDRPPSDLPGRGPRVQGGRRRRQRVRRLPQRLRRHGRRPRPSQDRRRPSPSASAGARTSPSRPRSRSSSPSTCSEPLRPAAVAVRQLGHRGDARRRAPDARLHRPRPAAQDRGQLPRPPRRRDGVGAAPRRQDRRLRRSGLGAADPGPAADFVNLTKVVPFNDLDALERTLEENKGRVAGHDRRAGDDERRHRPAGRRLPAGRQGPAARSTARCWPSTR